MRQVVVIGLGQFGMQLARSLVKMNCEVVAIDMNESRVNQVRDDVQRAIIGDARDFDMLASIVSASVDEAVVGLGESSIEPSILCTLHLKRIGVKVILSTARNDDHANILRAVGANEIIFPERETAERTARRIANPDLRDMFSLADDYRIMEIVAPKVLHGKSLASAQLRRDYDLLVLAIRPADQERFNFLPGADAVIHPNETLMVLGRELDLARFAGLD
ncbi:MAG: TrkA family potassium uptake protein [Phycisphaerales bacterium]|nr:TrkA family potassium uptake protein [Phycisphaerales bacterium]